MSYRTGPKIVTDGLVLCLDAADSNSYPGSGSTWYDLSGNNNHFTLNNSPTYSFEGGGNIIFDGTNDEAELSSWSWPSTCSISFFIYPLSGPSIYSRVISTGPSDNFEIALNQTKQLSYYTSTNSWQINKVALNTNAWNLITFSQSGSSLIIYKNAISSFSGSLTTSTGGSLSIGRRWNNIEPSNFKMAYLQVYNRTLSESEVLQNYNATKGRFGL